MPNPAELTWRQSKFVDMQTPDWAPTIPELLVSDYIRSRTFYADVLGFEVMYERGAPDFGMINLGRVQLMLQEIDTDVWLTGEMKQPFGRGINLEMEHADPQQVAAAVTAVGWPLFRPLADVTRLIGDGVESTSTEVLVQDPDGYLLRFTTP